MRRILVDHARSRHREKRGGMNEYVPLDEVVSIGRGPNSTDLMAPNEALEKLDTIDERLVSVVELRYFSGLTVEETAEVLKVSRTTVAQDWAMAKAWLHNELTRLS